VQIVHNHVHVKNKMFSQLTPF